MEHSQLHIAPDGETGHAWIKTSVGGAFTFHHPRLGLYEGVAKGDGKWEKVELRRVPPDERSER